MAGGKAKSAKTRKGSAKKPRAASTSRQKKASSAAKVKRRPSGAKTKPKAKSKTKVKKKAAPKRKTAKRATPKRKTAKRATPKRKTAKRKTAKRPGAAVKRAVSAAKRARKRRPTRVETILFAELENLAEVIHAAKDEISQIRPDEVKDEFLPKAANELDAIVEATADATHNIMDACDTLENVMASLDGDNEQKLMDATTKIYEACTFQDITGQRISKVVGTLHHIESRIDKLVAVFGVTFEKPESNNKAEAPDTKMEDGSVSEAHLLEGPQLKGQGRSQSEIDDLLASFD